MLDAYETLVAEGALDADPLQHQTAELLDEIGRKLVALERPGGFFAGLFNARKPVPKGAYIWGDVGRGKSLLMDLFFDTVPITAKRRVHFHEFMDEMHTAIAAFRADTPEGKGGRDPIPGVVKPILDNTRLLCFDEFHVTDITNAMLLQRLFEKMFAGGVVVVATSNVAPDRLYEHGLNRQLFLPFIALLKAHAHVLKLDGAKDYRLDKMSGHEIYHFGAGGEVAMDEMWQALSGGIEGAPAVVASLGREIDVPRQAMGVARFGFSDLCEQPLGARDYLKIANAYHTLIIDDVPQFDRTRTSAAKRFILLIDTLYDRGVKLAASFAVPLDQLGADDTTAFEFARCVSRLIEMRSEAYLAAARKAFDEG
jgi:cell division protein ZapE